MVQAEAAHQFLSILRNYLESLCSNLRSHTITNVQSSNDRVSECVNLEAFLTDGFAAEYYPDHQLDWNLKDMPDIPFSNSRRYISCFAQVSLLLKESFIDSFPNRDRPFIKVPGRFLPNLCFLIEKSSSRTYSGLLHRGELVLLFFADIIISTALCRHSDVLCSLGLPSLDVRERKPLTHHSNSVELGRTSSSIMPCSW